MNYFKIKASSSHYRLIIDEEASLETIRSEMREFANQLANINRPDQASYLIIDTTNRLLPDHVQAELTHIITHRAQWRVSFESNVISHQKAVEWHKQTHFNVEFGSINGGEIVEIDGDVLLVGDVEAGGFLRATGSIFVIGHIEGILNAGYKGDNQSVIVGTFSNQAEIRINKSSYSINHLLDDSSAYIPRVYYLNEDSVIDVSEVADIQSIRPDIDRLVSSLKQIEPRI